ncbi:MAG: AAA family ATPase [Planctomycetaceae bacterium]|nr:AAA family ATPase [Planctomycetaceae bacterium]
MNSPASVLENAVAVADQVRTNLVKPLKNEYVGKDEVIDLLGLCLVAGENLFLLGPPGTAKSALVRSLAQKLDGRVFDYLLTRFTEPSELFGPFDIRRLREGELQTNTAGMLPEADIIFLDELLNANSAILNSLLMALNERVFRRGRETRDLTFVLTVGASNRLPEDEALAALFDRFLLRVRSENVPDEMLSSVMEAGWKLQTEMRRPANHCVSIERLRQLQQAIPDVDVAEIRPVFVGLIGRLRHAGIEVSDRRAVRLQRLAAASALMCGRTSANRSDLWVVRYIWDTMEQVEVLAKIVDDTIQVSDDAVAAESVHPRASQADAPNPEHVNRDLDQIESQIPGATDSGTRSWLNDRLGILLARVEWIPAEEPRQFLKERIEVLLGRIDSVGQQASSGEAE